jgi:hypothetical protein
MAILFQRPDLNLAIPSDETAAVSFNPSHDFFKSTVLNIYLLCCEYAILLISLFSPAFPSISSLITVFPFSQDMELPDVGELMLASFIHPKLIPNIAQHLW